VKVGIIQSNYLPWRGYFDFIDDVDLFIFHDDVQYTKGDWRNRNRIKSDQGPKWITVPVHYRATNQLVCDTVIDYSHDWVSQHINQIRQWYGKALYYSEYSDSLFEILRRPCSTISDLNVALCRWVMCQLDITTPTKMSADFQLHGHKTERLIGLLKEVQAKVYISGPAGTGYLDENLFRENHIRLEYKSYDYSAYPQLSGEFISNVTVLDLLFNTGPNARQYLKSRSPNRVAVAVP